LEIGVLHGESLELWQNYFEKPNKRIYGLAYGAFTANEAGLANNKTTQLLYGDQSKKETMELVESRGAFDVIIDDGSHIPQHQIASFFSLWNSVKPGGMYIVEDIEVNYWNPKSMPTLYGKPLIVAYPGVWPPPHLAF
jgi:hypothetical protein